MKDLLKYKRKLFYIFLFFLALFVVLFVDNTWDGLSFSPQWFREFNKWLDLAWWVRLTYHMDLSQQREIYWDGQEFVQVRNEIEDIVLKNIDSRISQLGVSDYNSYVQVMDDRHYVVVELGGVQDIEAAREIIGKTVRLEFKLRADEPTEEEKMERQKMAEELLVEASSEDKSLKELWENRQGQDIYYNEMLGSIEQLPDIYSWNIQDLTEWEVHPTLL